MRIFSLVSALPWSASLRPEDAVDELMEMEEPPDDDFCRQMWELLHRGTFSIEQAKAVFFELHEVDQTTRVCEQRHKHETHVLTYHPSLEIDQLRARSQLGSARALMTNTQSENARARVEAQKERAEARTFRQLTGRQVFVQDALKIVATRGVAVQEANASRIQVMRTHAEEYSKLDAATKRHYELRAELLILERRRENRELAEDPHA